MRISAMFALLALIMSLPAAPAAAGAPPIQSVYLDPEVDAAIAVTPASERWTGEGFLAVRVRVENRAAKARSWTLNFDVSTDYNVSTSHEVALGAGPREVAETVIFVPGNGRPRDGHAAWANLTVEGPGAQGGGVQIVNSAGNDPFVVTAVSAAQETALFAATNGAPGPKAEISVIEAMAWPADWRTWSAFERVVLTEMEFTRLDGARRTALRDWAALGGVLDIYPDRTSDAPVGVREERVGLGVIRRLSRTLAEEETMKPGYAAFVPGIAAVDEATISDERRKELKPSTGRLGLSVFLVGFGLLVGPINLFVFAPANRRQRLFITVPALSLTASLLMAGYIVVKDGFGGEGSQRGLVVLVPGSNQAVVTQVQAARTGVLLGAEFSLPEDAALKQADMGESFFGGGMRPPAKYERRAGEAAGDWFASRRVQEQTLRQLVPTRARVELVAGGAGAGDAPVVVSSVGAVLRDFVYTDMRGGRWMAETVAPGQRVTLRVAKEPFVTGFKQGQFGAFGGAAEGLAPVPTLDSIRWDEPVFFYTGPVTEARKP